MTKHFSPDGLKNASTPESLAEIQRKMEAKQQDLQAYKERQAKIEMIQRELDRRSLIDRKVAKACIGFPQQLRFIQDPAKMKIVFCPRRSGKTTVLGIYMVSQALKYPNRKILYLALSQDQAVNILMTKEFYQLLDLWCGPKGYKINHTTKIITFKNNSSIRMGGLDAAPQARRRLLGGKYHMCVIDECQDQTQDLRRTISETLSKAVADYILKDGGIICMGGTPGTLMGEHYWYQCTKQLSNHKPDPTRQKGWSVHEWSVADNPYMVKEFAETCRQEREVYGPNYQDRDDFRSQWMCQWVVNATTKVYKYHNERNAVTDEAIISSLLNRDPQWLYLIGVDLGYEDATAFCVLAFSKTDPHCYIVESTKEEKMIISTIGAKLNALSAKYQPFKIVIDTAGGGKLIAESLRDIFRLPLYAASKVDKEGFIAKMNSDLFTGHLQVIEVTNKDLIEEWNTLIKDTKAEEQGVFKEAEKYDNHLADAALYAFKESKHDHAVEIVLPKKDDMVDKLLAKQRMANRGQTEEDYFEKIERQHEAKQWVDAFRNNNRSR